MQFQSCHRAVGVSAWQVAVHCCYKNIAASSFDTNKPQYITTRLNADDETTIELPVAYQALGAAFIAHVDTARVAGTGSVSTVVSNAIPCCWRLGLASSYTLLQKNIAASSFDTNNRIE